MAVEAKRARRCARVTMLTLLLFGALAGRSAAEEDPSVAAVRAAQAEFALAGRDVISLTNRAGDLRDERVALDKERDGLSRDQQSLADHQQEAEGLARRYVVQAYIGGRDAGLETTLINPNASGESVYRNYLVRDHTGRTRQVLHEYLERRRTVDQQVTDLARARDRNGADLRQTEIDLNLARQRWQLSELALRSADHDAALLAFAATDPSALGFIASGSDGGPTPEQSGNAAGAGWAGLRQCEAGGNYAAVSPSGQYRGAYQFDLVTWRGMGGGGDPAAAAPAEQDYRAQLLYNQRGAQPWPVCGKYLLADKAVRPVAAIAPPPGLPSHPVPTPLPSPLPGDQPPSLPAPPEPPTTSPPTPTTVTTSAPPTTNPPGSTTTTAPTSTTTTPTPTLPT